MAYVSAQLNAVADGGIGGAQPRMWVLYGTDVHTDADGTDFITDGSDKGMEVNDVVIYVRTGATNPGATLHTVGAVTAGGAATLTPAILA